MASFNLCEDSVAARRLICDHVQAIGAIFKIDLNDRQLQASCACARQKYTLSLEDEKKKKAQQADLKRKAVSEGRGRVKKLQISIQNDIDAMLISADEFAEKC